MSFSDYNCSLIVEPVSLLFLFCSSIARKHRQSGRRGKQVSLFPHEKELLAGEDEIRKLLAHQDRLQAQRCRRQMAEEQSSTSSTCSVIQSEGETEEEAEAAMPTLS
ncbi:hypothetical protein AB205_0056530 [Aquarana catesbeiana]|uniref:Uncharacterized protein n=1 Tax=Aquarana catesbeiana TaxID=8400 RepID=A0A2G9Q509_AQUCT|nr:hypothetical protein AB205_0056530 [Aquarana catesbeiana]